MSPCRNFSYFKPHSSFDDSDELEFSPFFVSNMMVKLLYNTVVKKTLFSK